MKFWQLISVIVCVLLTTSPVAAQDPIVPNPDHEAMLASDDPRLAANKRLVYDFVRVVFEAGRVERADEFVAEEYIQHNPNIPSGREAFQEYFSRIAKRKPIEPKSNLPIVAIVAEGDLVVFTFAREYPDPDQPDETYATTWFDMFRIEGDKIVEHWDAVKKHSQQAH